MKILLIEPGPLYFGGYYRSYEIAKAIASHGHQIHLLISSNKMFSFRIIHHKINPHFSIYELPRVQINFFINGRILRGIIALWYGAIGNYDIIHASSPVQVETNLPSLILSILNKKVVIAWDDIWANGTITNPLLKSYINFWENTSPKLFKNIVAISQNLQQKAKRLGATNTITLPNGTHADYPVISQKKAKKQLGLDHNKHYLITFGNTFNNNRNYLILRTFQHILKYNPDTILLTSQNLAQNLKEHHRNQSINQTTLNSVTNLGYIPDSQLHLYLSASSAILFVMGNSPNEKACYPVRLSKFLSSNRPIIIQENKSETTRVLKKFQCAIIANTIPKLAQKTTTYFQSKTIQRRLLSNCQTVKTEMDWQKLIKSLIQFYEKVLSS